MNIWRLIAHHEKAGDAIELMKSQNRIAIGWSEIGDLSMAHPKDQSEITNLILQSDRSHKNAHLGGPSLWNLYKELQKGDFVILNANGKRRCVFEVAGPYLYESGDNQILGYGHQRPAFLTSIDPNQLWSNSGSSVLLGQNVRWTLAACSEPETAEELIYTEGSRYSVISTASERNPNARERCLDEYGYRCVVCKYDFGEKFGELGEGYIHVHHRVDVSTQPSEYNVDPRRDLIPLCPNCHAMAHRRRPAIPIEELQTIYAKHNL